MNTFRTSVSLSVLLGVMLGWLGFSARGADEGVQVSPAISQVVKLHESGVSEDVIMAYARGSDVPKPTAEEIIYLSQKGISKDVMMALVTKQVAPAPAPATSHGSGRVLAKPVY